MRTVVLLTRAAALLLVLAVAAPAAAQNGNAPELSGCWPVTSRDRVVVQTDEGPARTGTLLCMGPEAIMLTGSGMLPLSSVRQISKPRDSYLDGMLKGAAVGLVFMAFCAPDCPAEYILRSTLAYATIGGVIDGLQGNNKTIYRRPPRAQLAWSFRF